MMSCGNTNIVLLAFPFFGFAFPRMAYRVDSAPTNHWGSQRFYRETPFSTKIKTTYGPHVLLTKKLNTRMRLTEPQRIDPTFSTTSHSATNLPRISRSRRKTEGRWLVPRLSYTFNFADRVLFLLDKYIKWETAMVPRAKVCLCFCKVSGVL